MKDERTLQRLIERCQISRVEITTHDGKKFFASAYPTPWGRVVEQRRLDAIATAAAGTDHRSFSMAEVNAISDKAASTPVAVCTGSTIAEAIAELAKTLREAALGSAACMDSRRNQLHGRERDPDAEREKMRDDR